jgi:hypothetical protein
MGNRGKREFGRRFTSGTHVVDERPAVAQRFSPSLSTAEETAARDNRRGIPGGAGFFEKSRPENTDVPPQMTLAL